MMQPTNDLVSPWIPITDPTELKYLGKLLEELGELTSAVSRCLIQGINETEPTTGKLNIIWLQEEIADVLANIELVREKYKLDGEFITWRLMRKKSNLSRWHNNICVQKDTIVK